MGLYGTPDIFNTDQGVQFTSQAFVTILQANQISISMDGKGRALDNVFIERFWRSLKQEKIYRIELETVKEAKRAIREYMDFYNNQRPHQSLDYQVPREIHFKKTLPIEMMDKSNDLPTVQQAQQQPQYFFVAMQLTPIDTRYSILSHESVSCDYDGFHGHVSERRGLLGISKHGTVG